jgi:hypothetical protein
MFYCERCGAGFNAGAAPSAMACPRCRARDGVFSPLTFTIRTGDEPGVRSTRPAVAATIGGRRSIPRMPDRIASIFGDQVQTKEEVMAQEIIEMWVFGIDSGIGTDPTRGVDVTGFGVEALDGSIGKVDEATYEENAHGLVVDTGPWIFGKKVVLPAGVIERVDAEEEKVYVSRTKDQIKDSPKFGEVDLDADARGQVGDYYGPRGAGAGGR